MVNFNISPLLFSHQPLAVVRSTLDLATISGPQNTFALGSLTLLPYSEPDYFKTRCLTQQQQHPHLREYLKTKLS